jgi:hypothetical protein
MRVPLNGPAFVLRAQPRLPYTSFPRSLSPRKRGAGIHREKQDAAAETRVQWHSPGLHIRRSIRKKRATTVEQELTDLCTLRAAMHEAWQRPNSTTLCPTALPLMSHYLPNANSDSAYPSIRQATSKHGPPPKRYSVLRSWVKKTRRAGGCLHPALPLPALLRG